MAERLLFETAEANVNKRMPKPKYEPIFSGITGMAVSAVVVLVFTTAAGLDRDAFGNAIAITAVVGFAAPYFYVRSQHRMHTKEIVIEYMRLQAQEEHAHRT